MVWITSTDTPRVVAALRDIARQAVAKEPYPLSTVLLRLTPSGWVVY